MQKVIVLLLLLCIAKGARASNSHFEKLKAHYPYTLLTNDFGVLNERDLAMNACDAEAPEPISRKSGGYSYWQCFKVKDATFECDDSGYDPIDKEHNVILAIAVHSKNEKNEYLSRRAIPVGVCKSFEHDWEKLVAKRHYVCLSGEVIKYKEVVEGTLENAWTFDKFKTVAGCTSYFEGACDFRYQIKHGCKIK